uniref:Uncharacterized protein n=1 Tax=Rhizophora mucronata TaxID=61149 RepID=A0A2P2PGN4_RHIMU
MDIFFHGDKSLSKQNKQRRWSCVLSSGFWTLNLKYGQH